MNRWRGLLGLLLLTAVAAGAQEDVGRIDGRIIRESGDPLGGVAVTLVDTGLTALTDATGAFHFNAVAPGTYSLDLALGTNNSTEEGLTVNSGATTVVDITVPWDVSYAETITVFGASRRTERIVEAPAAVTVVTEEQLERESGHGQLAKVLEFTPGAQVTQSGLYDFNLNTRGFNSSLNRRVPALIDGRDPQVPFLMSNDWPSMSSMSDMASVELVRGPSSALYGTNAYNGVLVLTTKQPRYSEGGQFKLSGGELSTMRADARWSGGLTDNTYLKVHGSYTQSDDFYLSRNAGAAPEYSTYCASTAQTNCLRREAAPLALDEDVLWVAGARLDHYLGASFLTFEGGTSYVEGPVIQTGIGRVQIQEADRPWARFNFSHPHFNFLAYANQRDAPVQRALASGANLVLDEENWATEIQGNVDFAENRGRLIGGASYKEEDIDTRGTLTLAPVGAERQAVYGQVEYAFSPKIKTVVAARWDDSSLHDGQVSPKVAFVFAPTGNQTVRLTYNQAFQSPNYSEFFLAAPAGAPVNLAAAAALNPQAAPLAPLLAALGFGCLPPGAPCATAMPILARGNGTLDVEEIESWEIGYSAIIGGKAFVTADYYNSELTNFVTDLLPGVNPAFAPYAVPGNLPAPVQAGLRGFLNAALGANVVGLSTLNGRPALVFSYTNAGAADTQGVDLGLNYYLNSNWNLSASYSWFDFELKEAQLGDRVLPNSPENSGSLGLGFTGERFSASAAYRYVEEFDWAAGVFVGTVEQYDLVDLSATYQITDSVGVGINVANAFDEEHYQSFGGDLIERRALGSVTFNW